MPFLMSHHALVQPLSRVSSTRVIVHDGELVAMLTQPEVTGEIEENELVAEIEDCAVEGEATTYEITVTLEEGEVPGP